MSWFKTHCSSTHMSQSCVVMFGNKAKDEKGLLLTPY